MRFTYAESMTDPSYYLPLARAAEAAGFDSFTVPDSICYPETSDSTYPYTPDGNREFLDGKPFIEPFVPSVKITPVPSAPLPILVGGHGEQALRRAARIGDGWMHAGGDPDELTEMLASVERFRDEYGRRDHPFEVHVISLDAYSIDGVRRLEELGVTDVIVGFRWAYDREPDSEPLQHKIDQLDRFAEDVIAPVNGGWSC